MFWLWNSCWPIVSYFLDQSKASISISRQNIYSLYTIYSILHRVQTLAQSAHTKYRRTRSHPIYQNRGVTQKRNSDSYYYPFWGKVLYEFVLNRLSTGRCPSQIPVTEIRPKPWGWIQFVISTVAFLQRFKLLSFPYIEIRPKTWGWISVCNFDCISENKSLWCFTKA